MKPNLNVLMRSDILMALFLLFVIFMMILPLPTMVVDSLIALNIGIPVVLLMVAVYMSSPLEFAGFPAVLLLTTLSRLALSITTTRLILLNGDAGHVVNAFGEYVVGGNIIVGLVIFLIITIVQFLVITKGSERVAEVAARFTLDGMPGKQMSIDGDLRAGLIDIHQARTRRQNIEKESQLYGAMDGAMKFVKGDAIAGLIIILVNIIGGVSIGVFQQGYTALEAFQTYSILTVGDGLIAQIPALIVSITAGLIVTRVSNEENKKDLGEDIIGQVFSKHQAVMAGGFILLIFGILPGFPTLIFTPIAIGAIVTGIYLKNTAKDRDAAGSMDNLEVSEENPIDGADASRQSGTTAPVVIDVAASVRDKFSVQSLNRELVLLRKALFMDLGVPFPSVHVRFTDRLVDDKYCILLQEVPVAEGQIKAGQVLVTGSPDQLDLFEIPYEAGESFLRDRDSIWVAEKEKTLLQASSIPFLEGAKILTYHLSLILKKYADDFIGIQETREILDSCSQQFPELVKEIQRVLPIQKISEIYQRLVSEDISIRNQRSILEAIVEWGPKEKDVVQLTEYIRSNHKRYISYKYSGGQNILPAYLLDEETEETIRQGIRITSAGSYLALDPSVTSGFVAKVKETVGDLTKVSGNPVLITSMDVRRYIKKLIELEVAELPVLSFQELTQEITVQPLGRISVGSGSIPEY